MGAFSASGTPAVMLDRNAAVILVNEPAERLFGRDLWVTGRHLACADRNAADALSRAFQVLLRNLNPPAVVNPVPLLRLGGRPLLAYPTRLPRITTNVFASCQIVVCFIDPDIHPHPSEVALRTWFGLTPPRQDWLAGFHRAQI
ncbi:hypothetical protein [Mesorhizobium muleiense]|uniref:hypothetical protein n=1 Tax=Mesorhizobium muleiense TaxID=1004279 RepID=UPI001F23E06D|nr:hypothetical protein [Mesorhizobium muleiense]MCF6109097.1 hypothetical protein [Mesorhizobium muleiense]